MPNKYTHAKAVEMFWSRVRKTETCWLWNATITQDGYGMMKWGGKNRGTHRIVWEIVNGAIPDGMCICHRCDNRRCVNPSHLFLGTVQDNATDKSNKGRAARLCGTEQSQAKLTEELVRQIRLEYVPNKIGHGQTALAKKYGVAQSLIGRVVRKLNWKHV